MYNHSDNAEKLNKLYCCTQAQSNMINTMISKTDDDTFKKDLSQHLHKFRALESELERTLRSHSAPACGNSKLQSAVARTSARLKLMGATSLSDIANILDGYTRERMSALEPTVTASQICDGSVSTLASKLKYAQQGLCKSLSSYL